MKRRIYLSGRMSGVPRSEYERKFGKLSASYIETDME